QPCALRHLEGRHDHQGARPSEQVQRAGQRDVARHDHQHPLRPLRREHLRDPRREQHRLRPRARVRPLRLRAASARPAELAEADQAAGLLDVRRGDALRDVRRLQHRRDRLVPDRRRRLRQGRGREDHRLRRPRRVAAALPLPPDRPGRRAAALARGSADDAGRGRLAGACGDGSAGDVRSARAGARLTLLAGIAALSLALGGAASAAGGVKASFKAITADGSFVVFETAARLVPSDFDSAVDVYARAGASTVLLSDRSGPGDAEIPATFEAVNGNGSVVVFETAESLLPADTDSAVDVYERAGSSIVLLSDRSGPGDPDIPAQFKAMRSDGAIVVFETAEPLLPADQDSAVDVY